jgi:hypothetical protein
MSLAHRACLVAGLLLAALAGPAGAMAVAGPGGTADQGRRLVLPNPAAATRTPTLDLVSTRLDAVDLAAGTVTVRGQQVPLHAVQLRVLGNRGQVLGRYRLRAGQAVRLALEPEAPVQPAAAASAATGAPVRRIVLIYVDE